MTLAHPPTLTGTKIGQSPGPATLVTVAGTINSRVAQVTGWLKCSEGPRAPHPDIISVRRYLRAEAAPASTRVQMPSTASQAGPAHRASAQEL